MFWGSLAGFTSTIIQVGAPPYQVHILPQRLDKLTLIGTTIIFFALVNVMKIVPYFALGQFSTRTLATSVLLLPLAVAANFLGLWLARRTPTELFYKIAYLLMLFISLGLIWQGASAILAVKRLCASAGSIVFPLGHICFSVRSKMSRRSGPGGARSHGPGPSGSHCWRGACWRRRPPMPSTCKAIAAPAAWRRRIRSQAFALALVDRRVARSSSISR